MKTTSAILLILSIANVWRAWGFAQHGDVMESYGAGVDPMELVIVAGGWAAVFLVLLIPLWRKNGIMRWIIPTVLLIYAVWIAIQPTPSLPLTIWHSAIIMWIAWRLRLIFRDKVADAV